MNILSPRNEGKNQYYINGYSSEEPAPEAVVDVFDLDELRKASHETSYWYSNQISVAAMAAAKEQKRFIK